MTVVEVLRGARAKIAQGWTRGALARRHGESVSIADIEAGAGGADCWCASGAIMAASGPGSVRADAWEALSVAVGIAFPGAIPAWNDAAKRTQAEVLAAFTRVIEAEERKAAEEAKS